MNMFLKQQKPSVVLQEATATSAQCCFHDEQYRKRFASSVGNLPGSRFKITSFSFSAALASWLGIELSLLAGFGWLLTSTNLLQSQFPFHAAFSFPFGLYCRGHIPKPYVATTVRQLYNKHGVALPGVWTRGGFS